MWHPNQPTSDTFCWAYKVWGLAIETLPGLTIQPKVSVPGCYLRTAVGSARNSHILVANPSHSVKSCPQLYSCTLRQGARANAAPGVVPAEAPGSGAAGKGVGWVAAPASTGPEWHRRVPLSGTCGRCVPLPHLQCLMCCKQSALLVMQGGICMHSCLAT